MTFILPLRQSHKVYLLYDVTSFFISSVIVTEKWAADDMG